MEYKKEDFPQKAIYRKPSNRIAFLTDFEDGQEVQFVCFHSRPASLSEGYAYYESTNGKYKQKLISIRDLEEIK